MKDPRKRTPKQKFDLLWRMWADTTLSLPARAVATALLLKFHNEKTGRCNPGVPGIAKTAGLSRRAIYYAIAELKDAGWISVESIGGGSARNSNRYSFDFKRMKSASPPTGAQYASHTGAQDAPVSANCARTPAQFAPELLRTTRASGAGGEGGKTSQRAPDGALAREEEFGELLQLWSVKPHGINKDKARAAFLRVIADGTSPEKILNSARQWVAAKAKEPRFLPALETWLDNGAWQNDPPTQLNGKHHKPSAAEAAANLVREAERNGR